MSHEIPFVKILLKPAVLSVNLINEIDLFF